MNMSLKIFGTSNQSKVCWHTLKKNIVHSKTVAIAGCRRHVSLFQLHFHSNHYNQKLSQ